MGFTRRHTSWRKDRTFDDDQHFTCCARCRQQCVALKAGRAGAHPQRQHETELGATLQPFIDSCPQFDSRRAQILRAALGVRVILCQRLQLMRDLY